MMKPEEEANALIESPATKKANDNVDVSRILNPIGVQNAIVEAPKAYLKAMEIEA